MGKSYGQTRAAPLKVTQKFEIIKKERQLENQQEDSEEDIIDD